jgi:hypothetical protein
LFAFQFAIGGVGERALVAEVVVVVMLLLLLLVVVLWWCCGGACMCVRYVMQKRLLCEICVSFAVYGV